MPEETAVAEPQPEASDKALAPIDNFGNVSEAFDKAFPATAEKPEPVTAEPTVVPELAAPEKKVETAPAAKIDDGLPPDDVFGDKPTTKKEEPEPQIEAPKSVKENPEAYKNWKELRSVAEERGKKLRTLETEVASLREKVEASTTDEGLVARLAELEAVNKELTDRQATFDVQSSDVFQKQFVQPRQKKVGEALEIAKEAGVEASDIERLIGLPPRAQKEALDEVLRGIDSPTLQNELTGAIKDIRTIDRGAASVLADSKGNLEKLRQHAKAQEYAQMAEHAKFIDRTITAQATKLAESVAFFRKIDGNEEWNKGVDSMIQEAKEIATNSKDEGQLLGGIVLGVAFPKVYNALIATRKALQQERAINAENKAADPGLNGSRAADSGSEVDDKLSFAEAVARQSGLR